jgi:hypothetical protein
MCAPVAEIFEKEFNRPLGHPDVHILDPCTGTGHGAAGLRRAVGLAPAQRGSAPMLPCVYYGLLDEFFDKMLRCLSHESARKGRRAKGRVRGLARGGALQRTQG